VTVERTAGQVRDQQHPRGKITLALSGDADFRPTELLLGAIGACTAIDVDTVTSRRAEPTPSKSASMRPRCETTRATG
jgi:uncharacterized OsmC-like protein